MKKPKFLTGVALSLSVLGLIATLTAFYPGMMPAESIAQFIDVTSGKFIRHRPPVLSLVWSLLDPEGPGGILLLQNFLFWSATGVLAVLTIRRGGSISGIAIAALGFLAPDLSALGVLWKETSAGAALLAGLACFEVLREKRRPGFLALGVLLLFFGGSITAGGVLAVMPLAFYGWHALSEKAPWWRKLTAAALTTLAIAIGSHVVSQAIAKDGPDLRRTLLAIYDLGGIEAHNGQVEWPAAVPHAPSYGSVKALYSPSGVTPLFRALDLHLPVSAADLAALEASRSRAISQNPVSYLAHRWGYLLQLLGVSPLPVFYPYEFEIAENPMGLSFKPNGWSNAVFAYITALSESALFRAALWLVLAAGGCTILLRRRPLDGEACLPLALLASGLLSALPYLFTAVTADFRYAWWTLLSAQIAFLMTEKAIAARPAAP